MEKKQLAITLLLKGNESIEKIQRIKEKLIEQYLTDRVIVIAGCDSTQLIITEL